MSRRRFVQTRLEPAIRGLSCPICLCPVAVRRAAVLGACLHAYCVGCIERWGRLKRKCPLCNAGFDSWFFGIDLASRSFRERRLPKDGAGRDAGRLGSVPSRGRVALRRVARRTREELNWSNQRTRPLPIRRWFGNPGPESSDDVALRVLQWRASIYEQRLQAVSRSCYSDLQSNTKGDNGAKERILKRKKPWIYRELKAILGDPDPSIIVHVASSLFISSMEAPANLSFLEDDYLEPLRRFLHGLTNMFWHELRCFAGSPFNMETYDAIVEYRKMTE